MVATGLSGRPTAGGPVDGHTRSLDDPVAGSVRPGRDVVDEVLPERDVRAASSSVQIELLELVAPLRRYVATRVATRHDVEDVVQETLARVLDARYRLEEGTLLAYAFVVARNVITSAHRDRERARRHAPLLIDLREPERPDAQAAAGEDRRALGVALADLAPVQRDLLLAHDLHDEPLGDLALEHATNAPAVAAQLARIRAKLRLDYLLALNRTKLPTSRCRPVLLAVSAGDKRRQRALAAAPHLLHCDTCGRLSPPLLARQRALAGLLPWMPLGAAHGRLVRLVRTHPVSTSIGTAAVAVGTTAAILAGSHGSGPAPAVAPTAAPTAARVGAVTAAPAAIVALRSPRGPVVPDRAHLSALVGDRVTATRVRVLSVPADEGFWVGTAEADRVWVQMSSRGESGVQVRRGQLLSFPATVRANSPTFGRTVGVSSAEGGAMLADQSAHLAVDAHRVTVAAQR